MVDRSIALRKISRIRHYLSRIKERGHISLQELLNDLNTQDIILHNLQLAIQGCIDLGSHIVSDEGWGIPGSFSEIFRPVRTRRQIMDNSGRITGNTVTIACSPQKRFSGSYGQR